MRFRNVCQATVAGVAVLLLSACNGSLSSSSKTPPPADVPADLVFEQDGKTLEIVAGNVYERRGDTRKFMQALYDPDYKAKNFVVADGKRYQLNVETGERYATTDAFRDDFEGARNVDELVAENRWHRYSTDPRQRGVRDNYHDLGNRITISTERVHSGKQALKFHALPYAKDVSKASIKKGIFYFEQGDDLYFSGWYFIEDTPSLYDAGAFTLLDIESSFQEYVGMRVIFRQDDSLAFESKMPKRTFAQPGSKAVKFPTGQWVHLKVHLYLHTQDGLMEIWQDGTRVLHQRGQTLSLPDTVYDNVEVGVTVIAKGSRYEKVLYLDDVAVAKTPL